MGNPTEPNALRGLDFFLNQKTLKAGKSLCFHKAYLACKVCVCVCVNECVNSEAVKIK